VIFSVDMRQLLAGVGMKPADIERIMATAEANAKKGINAGVNPFAPPPAEGGAADDSSGGGGQRGGNGGGGRRSGGTGAPATPAPAGRGAAGAGTQAGSPGPGGRGGFANLSDEDRKKLTDLRQKMQAASPEDREKLQKQMTDLLTKAGITPGQGRGASGQPRTDGQAGAGFGGQGRSGADMAGMADPLAAMMRRSINVGGFTEEDRKNARLPLPPEQDSQVQVLLRPGLLADVEIQVEKLPDVIHVPAQAVFQKNGQFLVYVHAKNGKFEPRPVRLVKQSESMMVISSGLEAGEVVAMADPTAGKKNGEKKAAGGNAMGGMGGGK
jgi:hypothetical protein